MRYVFWGPLECDRADAAEALRGLIADGTISEAEKPRVERRKCAYVITLVSLQ